MTGVRNGKLDLAREIIKKYIEIGKQTGRGYSKNFIATVLVSENPDIFKDQEEARFHIRRALGSKGGDSVNEKSEELKARFALISEPVHELIDSTPFVMPQGYKSTLFIADLHSRFYNRQALEIAINDGIKQKCDSIIILGDFMDFYGDSKFDKNPSIVQQFEAEREWGQDILKLLQDTFGYVVLKKGNHDIRRELHIQRLAAKMPEIQGLESYSDYLFYEGTNTQFIEGHRVIEYGKLGCIHGHEYQGGGGIHAAYNRLNKAKQNVVSAHSHISQRDIRMNLKGEPIGSWTLGCMCNLNPAYNPKNDWTNGFGIGQKDASGDFEFENKVIFGSKIFT
jgi:predicted phosphodiesterase